MYYIYSATEIAKSINKVFAQANEIEYAISSIRQGFPGVSVEDDALLVIDEAILRMLDGNVLSILSNRYSIAGISCGNVFSKELYNAIVNQRVANYTKRVCYELAEKVSLYASCVIDGSLPYADLRNTIRLKGNVQDNGLLTISGPKYAVIKRSNGKLFIKLKLDDNTPFEVAIDINSANEEIASVYKELKKVDRRNLNHILAECEQEIKRYSRVSAYTRKKLFSDVVSYAINNGCSVLIHGDLRINLTKEGEISCLIKKH